MDIPLADIHNHILPGVDDGFRSPDDSLEALKAMAAAGCREVVFTPHMNPDVYPDVTEGMLREAYASFRNRIPEELGISTRLAAEYMIVAGFEKRVSSRADELLSFPDGSVLVEMSYQFPSLNLEQSLFELNMAGLKPILAHPERYLYLADSLSFFDRIADMGCGLQLNLISLTGAYGPQSKKIMNHLLASRMYSSAATDLHSLRQLEQILSFKPGIFLRRRLEASGIMS